ncbi:MAG: sarcosine oxidase subunit gamma family protein [Steroidobacteraceae bacterium]
MLEHRPPVRIRSAGGANLPGRRDLHIVVQDQGLLLIQGDPRDALLGKVIQEELGLRLPDPLEASVRHSRALLWTTPREWLLIAPRSESANIRGPLITQLASTLVAVTDISDALACFEVAGAKASDTLMTGCTLDLRPEALVPGRVVRTAVAGVPMILWRPAEAGGFRCFVDRSWAEHFSSWLLESAVDQQARPAVFSD